MNINKLENGKKFKNYKVLCEELGMEVKSGAKSKNYQMRELERYCVFHKDGHSIIIDEVFETPLPKIDGRKNGNNSVYNNYLQILILDLLAQTKEGHISISKNKLMRTIAITNINYGFCNENVPKLAKYIESPEEIIYDFYNTSSSSFKGLIETALNILEDKRIIMFNKVTKVSLFNKETRLASDLEKSSILNIEKSLLEELGYEKISQVRKSSHWKEFRNKANVEIQKELNINFYYEAYDISVNQKYIEEELTNLFDLLLEDAERNEYKNDLNSTIRENLLKNANKRHEDSFHSKSMGKYRGMDNYVDTIEQLNNLLIDRDAPNIIPEIVKVELETPILDDELYDLFG